ncbi:MULTISPECIES: DUF3986 family protein [Halobacillus]|uniref:DUF3986 family protein n=1 Tax=Halobacillus TaxID=45667 RepID=UPI00040F55EC|nr:MULTISPECIES: DUF3986 family protein [Halobacillus]
MYNPDLHFHIGYYEGYDLEVVAYKRIWEPLWDVYVDDSGPGTLYSQVMNKGLGVSVAHYGILIFSIDDTKNFEKQAYHSFEKWLRHYKLIDVDA